MLHFVENFNLKHSLIIYLWIDYLWEQYLRARQYKLACLCTQVPPELENVMQKNLFDKSRRYMLARKRFAFVKDLFSIAISTIVILYDFLPILWDEIGTTYHLNEVGHSLVWYFLFTTLYSILKLPLTIYEIFVIEGNGPEILVWQKIRNFVLSQIIVVILSSILIEVVEMGDKVLVGAWIVFCSLIAIVGIIYPMTEPSRFRSLTLLRQGELRAEISDLASQLNFPLQEIYVEERFKRDTDSLYIYGTTKSKSLVLYDFLVPEEGHGGCTNQEILALFCHGIGQWYYKSSVKYILLLEFHLFLSFAAFFLLFRRPEVFKIFGFHKIQPVFVGVYLVLKYVMTFYSTLLCFWFMYFSRKFIIQCDEFVAKQGRGNELSSALIKVEDHLKFPVYDHLYSLWHHDKPSLLERVSAIKKFAEKYA